MKPAQIWQAAQGELQLQMTRATYDTWVKPTYITAYDNNIFTIVVPQQYAKEWWESRLTTTVDRILTGITGHPCHAVFVVGRPN